MMIIYSPFQHRDVPLRPNRLCTRMVMFCSLLMVLFALTIAAPHAAYAADPLSDNIPDGTCTSEDKYFKIDEPDSGMGLVSSVIDRVQTPLADVASKTFQGIVGNPDFKNALRIAATIYVAVYGLFFTFGMVQITVHDLMVRLCKIAIINVLISPNAWTYFNNYVVKFFNGAVDDIIKNVSAIAVNQSGTAVGSLMGSPFDPLDQALVYLASSKMAVTLLATFATGPYGFVIGLILAMSIGSFLKALFNALYIYVMAYVIRTLMFGMAPLFIVCILFSRTRHLFDGWLNQIINATLQPIFLFTFFAFFVLLIRSCLEQVLATPVCWMPTGVRFGSPGVTHFWRFAIAVCDGSNVVTLPNGKTKFQSFDGLWGFNGAEGQDVGACNQGKVHPMGIILPLMIWILADLAGRFNHIVIEIAKDLSNAATDLSMGAEGIKKWFSEATDFGALGNKSAGSTGVRGAPGSLGDIARLLKDNPGGDPKGPPPRAGGTTVPVDKRRTPGA